MMNYRLSTLVAACGMLTSVCLAQNERRVAICPFEFTDGNVTSRTMVIDSVAKIFERNGYTVITQTDADSKYQSLSPAARMNRGLPMVEDLGRFAASVNATHLVYGRAEWHTRSIWVGTGPKTISTAHVDICFYNAKTGKTTYTRSGEGRSDEKESLLKDIGDVLVTPLITVVSGGPATPREQRAAQIAIWRAMRPWVQQHRARNR